MVHNACKGWRATMCFEVLVTMVGFRKLRWFKCISQLADLLAQYVKLIGKEQNWCRPVMKETNRISGNSVFQDS